MTLRNLIKIFVTFGVLVVAVGFSPLAMGGPTKITIVAVGDVCPFLEQGNLVEKDLPNVLGPGAKWISGADIAFANLEAPIIKPGMKAVRERDLPILVGRLSLPTSLARAGFDVVSLANNHTYDFGAEGVAITLDAVKKARLAHTGLGFSRKAAEKPVIMEVKGIKVAFIAATDRVNQPQPSKPKKAWTAWVRIKRLERQVRRLRKKVHVVVVSLHWGISYNPKPIDKQKRIAQRLAAAGADLILGGHPHVLQPVVFASRSRRTVIAYSMGNFLFGQQEGVRGQTMVLGVDFVLKKGQKRARPVAVSHLPLVVNKQRLLRPPWTEEVKEIYRALKKRSPALGWKAKR